MYLGPEVSKWDDGESPYIGSIPQLKARAIFNRSDKSHDKDELKRAEDSIVFVYE